MALLKNKDYNGCTTTYHKIGDIILYNGQITCGVESFLSKEDRANEEYTYKEYFRFYITLEEEESMGIRQLGYTKLKEMDAWKGAEDC